MRQLLTRLLLCCAMLFWAMPVQAAPSVDMTVKAANEGRARQGGWVTVLVDLANLGGEMSGDLVVESAGEEFHPQYVVPFALPAGGTKRIPVTLQTPLTNSSLKVRLLSDGELVAEERVNLTYLPPQAALVGLLSGDELGIPALAQLEAAQSQTAQVVRLSASSLADSASLLADFDIIALSRFDTGSLSPAQLRALEAWVGRGGTLMLAGGPEWARTLKPLPAALLPVDVTGVGPVSLAPLGEMAGLPLAQEGAVSLGRLMNGQALLRSGEVPLIASAAVGSGRVIYLAFDPGLNPVVAWPGQVQLFNRLLGGAGGAAQSWTGDQSWLMFDALRRLPEWALPSVWLIGLLLGGYLLLVGPANYLVLKRFDRREWAWASVPVISVLFLGLVYLMGFGRIEPLVSHLITATELPSGTGSATTTAYLGLYAPSRIRLSVPVEGGGLISPFMQNMGGRGATSVRVVSGERTTVEFEGLSSYSMTGFRLERDVPVTGGLRLIDATIVNNTLTARLKNETALAVDGLSATIGTTVAMIGRLEPGETSPTFTLPLAGGTLNPKLRGGIIRTEIGVGDEADQRRELVRSYVLNDVAERLGRSVLVSGWTAEPPVPLALGDLGKMVGGANLVYAVLPLPVGESGADIPAGLVQGRPSEPQGVEWVPSGYLLLPGSHPFTMTLPPLDAAGVESITLDLRQPLPTGVIRAEVKNQKSGEWIPVAGQTLELPVWQEFVTPGGVIELRYETDQHSEIMPPTVTVQGVSR